MKVSSAEIQKLKKKYIKIIWVFYWDLASREYMEVINEKKTESRWTEKAEKRVCREEREINCRKRDNQEHRFELYIKRRKPEGIQRKPGEMTQLTQRTQKKWK